MEVSKINGYDVKDKKAIRTYDTVALMKADTKLKEGQHVKTRGYYSINDCGSSEYLITQTQSESDIQETLQNGLYATLIIENDEINVKQIGAYGDETHDDTNIIQKALNSGFDIYIPSGTYNITLPLTLPFNKKLRGNSKTDTILNSTIVNDYIIYYGDNYNYGQYKGKISNIKFKCENEINNKSYGIFLNSGIEIDNCEFSGLSTVINRVNKYIDLIKFTNNAVLYCIPLNNTYILNFDGNSDGLFINQLKFESYNDDTTNYNGILIATCHGGCLDNSIINCNVTLINNTAFSMNNNHIEGLDRVININNSNIEISNLFKFKNTLLNDINIFADANTKNNAISLNNITFARQNSNYNNVASKEINELPINTTLHIKDCYRLVNFADANIFSHVLYGIEIENRNDYNILSGIYSKNSEVINNKSIYKDIILDTTSVTGLGTIAKNNAIKWLTDTVASLNYRAVNICDEERKIICGYSSNGNIANVTQNEDGIFIAINNDYYNKDIYLYRGTNLDEYTQRVKISNINRNRLIDNGLQCCMKNWETVESTNGRTGYINVQRFIKNGDNVIIYHSTTPNVGTWKKYDKVINTNTESGQVIEWFYDGTNWIAQGEY